jgi:hypothetical protein
MGERRPGHVVWWPARTRTCVNHFPCSLGVRREHPGWCRSQDPVSWLGDSVGMLSRTETTSRPIASQPATRPGLRPARTHHRPVAVHHRAAALG